MAGKRQHYVPQFLQRGFLADHSDDAERTWLHRRGTTAKLVGIRDVGVGEHFYSRPSNDGLPTLDDQITEAEGQIFASLKSIKDDVSGTGIDSSVAAHLVAHLTLRTAHVRSSVTQGAMLVLDHVVDYVGNSDRMREELGIDVVHPEKVGSSFIGRALSSVPIEMLPLPPELAKRVIAFFAREKFDEMYEQTKPQLVQATSIFGRGISKSIQDAHGKVLSDSDLSGREKALATLSWRTQYVFGALLPDCIALAREEGGAYVPLLLSNWDAVDCVVLPISHEQLLVGSRRVSEELPISVVNEASSTCSDNFFISQHPDHGESLSSLIGQRCTQIISAHVRSAVLEMKSSKAPVEELLTESEKVDADVASSPFNFTMTCLGFGDEEMATALSHIIKLIVMEVGRDMPLSGLDGVTFAIDYGAAVEQLDRGDVSLGADRSQSRDYGRAVAKCVRVNREGQYKEHIVFDAIIAYELLQEQSEGHSDAIHLIVNMLSHVAHGTLFEEKFKGKTIVPPDDISSLLHQCVSSVPGMYYAARQGAFSAPAAGERFATLTLDSYNFARDAIRSARLAYRLDDNLDGLLEVALPKIAFVLEHAAQWLGHRDGLPSQEAFPGMSLIEDLKTFDLDRWLELFGHDLRRLYATEDQFSAENIFGLGRHAERLLWTVQICPWPMQDGATYVTVPMGNDEQELQELSPSSG